MGWATSRWRSIAFFLSLVIAVTVVSRTVAGQDNAAPSNAPVTQADLQNAVKQVKEAVDRLTTIVSNQNELINNLQRDVITLKKSGNVTAAVAGTTPPAPDPSGQPRVSVVPTVPADFWTLDAAQRLGLYRFEPRIKEATTMVGEVFGLAANEAAAAKTPEELEAVPGKYRELFLKKLTDSGRTDLTVQTWGNAVDAWLAHVKDDLSQAATFEAYQKILVDALRDGQKNAPQWGVAIDKAHDDSRGGAVAGAGGGGNSTGVGSGVGYLPPMAAFHYAWHVRKMNRLQARGNLYSGR